MKNFSPLKTSRTSSNRSPNATITGLMRLNDANLNNRLSALTVDEPSNNESAEREEWQAIQTNSNQSKGRNSMQSSSAKQSNGAKPSVTIHGGSKVKHVEVLRACSYREIFHGISQMKRHSRSAKISIHIARR